MRVSRALSGLNRHSASVFLLALFLGFCVLAHFTALARMEGAGRHFAIMDARTVREMAVIDFVHGNVWIVIAYTVVFAGSLLWLEIRGFARWWLWAAFAVFALPCAAYSWGCVHIGGKFILWTITGG
jgi:hypothetical protein